MKILLKFYGGRFKKMKPKIFSIMKNSPGELKGKNLVKDIVAGLIVAVVALHFLSLLPFHLEYLRKSA